MKHLVLCQKEFKLHKNFRGWSPLPNEFEKICADLWDKIVIKKYNFEKKMLNFDKNMKKCQLCKLCVQK